MTLTQFVTKVNYALRGIDEDAPSDGDEEWNYWTTTLNQVKDTLFENIKQWGFAFSEASPNEPGTVATAGTTTLTGTDTNFEDYAVGDTILVSGETSRIIAAIASDTSLTSTVAFTTTASGKSFTHTSLIVVDTQTYKLHRRFLSPSDELYITKTDGTRTYFPLIKPQARTTTTQEVFVSGINPEEITFTQDIETGNELIGGTITLPSYYKPVDISSATDLLPFLNNNWAVYAVASEIAFNDITYEDKAPDLNSKANSEYYAMLRRNRRGTFDNPRTSTVNADKIRGY